MRVLIDANIVLDRLILEKSGLPHRGKAGSETVINLCDRLVHHGLIAWHTLPILSYYYRRQHSEADTALMMDGMLAVLEVPVVGHADAIAWRASGVVDFEDALQVTSALSGGAERIVTRNVDDFANSPLPAMNPEDFLLAHAAPGSA